MSRNPGSRLLASDESVPVTLRSSWIHTRGRLEAVGIPEPSLEAEVLIRHVLGIDRVEFYASLGDILDARSHGELFRLADRRCAREPLAYITGRREFYGMEFAVGPDVLIPRPESELLVELALERLDSIERPVVLDVGTGSGCVALAIAARHSGVTVHAVDASAAALEVAESNCFAHGLAGRVHLHCGDLLTPEVRRRGPFDLVVSNPPYVPSSVLATLNPEVLAEPVEALDGGADGLEPTGRLLAQLGGVLTRTGSALVEIYSENAERTVGLAHEALPGAAVAVMPDLDGLPRVLAVAPCRESD